MSSWLVTLAPALAVAALAALVLLADAVGRVPGRALGYAVTAGLLGVFAATFVVDLAGAAPHGVFVSNAFVVFFERVLLLGGVLGTASAVDWLAARTPQRQAEYHALMLFSLAGMMILPGARDWILLVTAFELMGIPLYVLAAYAKTDAAAAGLADAKLGAEAGLKLFVTGAASTALTLFGLALVVGTTGTTHIGPLPAGQPLGGVGMLLVLSGFAFKVGAAPFHMWIPDTYQGAPLPFVSFLSVAPKLGGLASLAVVLAGGWSAHAGAWQPALAVLCGVSMLVGNLFAVPQTDVRRLLGYSGVAQLGTLLLGLCANSVHGVGAALFYGAVYLPTNVGAFLVVYAAAESSGGYELGHLTGLSRRSPWLGGALLVFLLSLAGIPFVAGFWAKVFVLLAAWHAGFQALAAAGVVLAVIGLFYYMRVARATFMSEGTQTAPIVVRPVLKVLIVACLLAVVGTGLWPRPLVDASERAAAALVVPSHIAPVLPQRVAR